MVRPMTFSPRACSMPATTELSTPPDLATARGFSCMRRRQLAQVRDGVDQRLDERIHLFDSIGSPQGKTDTRASLQAAQAHRQQNVGWLGRPAGAGRTARYGESFEIQRNQ